jgi:hypothetical protein
MAFSPTTGASTHTRHTIQSMMRKVSAGFTGHERGNDRSVRRNSYDIDDRRAQVFRRIGDGSVAGALGWIDCFLRTIAAWDDDQRKKGGIRPLGFHGLRVLEALLGRRGGIPIDFATGRIDPALDTIAASAKVSKTTVVRALARLKAIGAIDWVRRTQAAESVGCAGPQREQISNAYWIDATRLPAKVGQYFRDLLARKQLRRQAAMGGITAATQPPAKPSAPVEPSFKDSELQASFDRLAKAVGASSPSGQYPGQAKE